MRKPHIVAGLDVGTTKVCALIGELTPTGVDIVGIGQHPSRGLRKGMVVNIDSTVEAIKRAVAEAEQMAGVEVDSVYTSIGGGHISGVNSQGVVAVQGRTREVATTDVERAIEVARDVDLPPDREILHVLTQAFSVDDQDGIREPIGMLGSRLGVEVHLVTGAVTAVQNVVRSVNRAGLTVKDLVLQPLASAESVLTPDERDLGVAVIDVGGGTTDVVLFRENAVWHTAVIPLGGDHITNDIAVGLRTPPADAEELKIRYGCALRQLADANEMVEVPGVGDRPSRQLSRQVLAEVIEPRVEELYSLVQKVLRDSGYEELLSSGVVLTGGSAVMQGMVELGEEIFHMPVRLGIPRYSGGLSDVVRGPRYATAVGLLLEGKTQMERGMLARQGGSFKQVFGRMREWFQRNF